MTVLHSLQGVVVVSHGADLSGGAAEALTEAGITFSAHAAGDHTVHLVPYGDALAVIIDPDAPPIEWLSYPLNPAWLLTAVRTAVELMRAERAIRESHTLLDICRAMASVRDSDQLERMILRKARELTNADAGSLYLLDSIEGQPALRFAVAQTGPHDDARVAGEITPLSDRSIAGWVALHGEPARIGDAYVDSPRSTIRFDASFDRATGYRTKSVLCAPIRNNRNEILGVLQLINKKQTFEAALSLDVLSEELIMPFDDHDEEIVTALAAQAGVVLENASR
ncbi:MAG TPA: GAF domain-containing protein [Candidatus Baltobacteraceae bacterium]|nr:GAF domain-containing protein [Candidatus Baltobacteraceae bacterium]